MSNKISLLRAEALLNTYRLMDGTDGSDVSMFSLARDLITDLMHYVEETRVGLASDLADSALSVYEEEAEAEFHD
jgi:hypothetical protein